MSSFEAYAEALDLLEMYLARRRAGTAEPEAEFLAARADLAEILAPLLTDARVDMTRTQGGRGTEAWRGLPGEGQSIGGYRVERLLGQGGMGVVFLAEDVRLNRKVALKLIRPERLGSKPARDRFWREAKLAARLEHPNICPVYEVGDENGTPFMAMRFLEGETLATRIAPVVRAATTATPRSGQDAERRRVDELLQLVETVARALHFAHGHGVVHRDVKPANILIEPDGTPIVLDFGMAVGTDDDLGLTMTGELAGTPLYMAPEQVVPTARGVDARADVYALGVTLYEAATGVRPFGGQSMRELLDAIVKASAPPASRHNRSLPGDLDVVLEKALEKDVDRRYRTAADMADELVRVRAHQPVLARRASRFLRTRRWMQRNPLAVAFMTLMAGAFVVITLLYLRGEAARADFDMVSFVRRLDELNAAEARLYDAGPEHGAALQAWLEEATRLRADVESVRPALLRLGRQGENGPTPPDESAPRFLFETLQSVVAQSDALVRPTGAIPRAQRNLEHLAREMRERDAHAAAWREAAAAIRADPRYKDAKGAGLEVTAQLGLVPLGPDPTSGLYEFGHPRSGTLPERDSTGRFAIGDDTGIVFVLLPGGKFVMGASRDETLPNHDPLARRGEGPPHEVTLAPFLLGKYELTQGQWMRLSDGRNPADARPGSNFRLPLTLAHPVELVTWQECTRLLLPAGLSLPTEAQWEYGARGGTDTPWWTGADVASLAHRVNVADETASKRGAEWFELVVLELLPPEVKGNFEDGFVWHAPVDTLEPNAFGLFGVAGNVWEWCRDSLSSYADPPDPGDGLRGKKEGLRVVRGGAFDHAPLHARASMRRQEDPAARTGNLGLRAARALR